MSPLSSNPRRPNTLATRAGAALLGAGALLILATVLLPPAAAGSDTLILVVGALCAAMALALLRAGSAPLWALGVAAALGTLMITVSTSQAGIGTGAEDNEILYLWICLYSFYFFPLRMAFVQMAIVAVAYGLLLISDAATQTIITRWLTTVSTLTVAGLLIAKLRHSLSVKVRELQTHAGRDPLTNILNRRALEEYAHIRVADAHRNHRSLTVIVADLDGLKEVNDSLGHAAGDEALCSTAAALEGATRRNDTVARTGGDEFVALLPGVGRAEAQRVAMRLLKAARESELPVRLSVGIATEAGTDVSFESLWRAADAVMYRAKREGGDRFEVALPLSVTSGELRTSEGAPATELPATH